MNQVLTVIGVFVAAVSAVAAVAAWRAAVGSRKAAAELATIERARRHAELTPQLVTTIASDGPGRFLLRIHLDGPLELGGLDQVVIAVRNDTADHTPLTGDVTPEESNAQIWGPLRFTPGMDNATADGRQVGPISLQVGDDRPFQMELSKPPRWADAGGEQWWRRTYQGGTAPLRLAVTCRKDGEGPWIIPIELTPSRYEFGVSAV